MSTRYDHYGWESPDLDSVMDQVALRLGIPFDTWWNEDRGGTYYEWEGSGPREQVCIHRNFTDEDGEWIDPDHPHVLTLVLAGGLTDEQFDAIAAIPGAQFLGRKAVPHRLPTVS